MKIRKELKMRLAESKIKNLKPQEMKKLKGGGDYIGKGTTLNAPDNYHSN